MHDIKISVLMPAYNAAGYIGEAIESVLSQSFTAFELIIVDDGSVDETASVIRSYTDRRIVLIQQKNKGIAAALNTGMKIAKANLIARFDADDICFSNRLEKQYAFMMAHPGYLITGSGADYIDENGNYVYTHVPVALTDEEIKNLPISVCPFIHASVIFRKEIIASIGYNENAPSFQDHLLWQQVKKLGGMYNFAEPLLKVRLNPSSLTIDERKRSKEFRQIKNNALLSGSLNVTEGLRLRELIQQQNNTNIKKGAYYTLLAKKFLWNNYNPQKARTCVKKAIALNPFDIKDYLLWPVSYLPERIIKILYNRMSDVKQTNLQKGNNH